MKVSYNHYHHEMRYSNEGDREIEQEEEVGNGEKKSLNNRTYV